MSFVVAPQAGGEHRFNGAAAKSSGKFTKKLSEMLLLLASMGPPLKAAENLLARKVATRAQLRSFNGAAAKSSGKYEKEALTAVIASCFNGAAAKSSGK